MKRPDVGRKAGHLRYVSIITNSLGKLVSRTADLIWVKSSKKSKRDILGEN